MSSQSTGRGGVNLTEEQESAADRISTVICGDGKSELRVGGYAGTGKTTILKSAISRSPDVRVAVCALAGKAVEVLRRKGLGDAKTIHSTIYDFDHRSRSFFLRDKLSADAILVDEASMIGRDLYSDLSSFGLPMVFVGDMGQLEPVGSDLNLMDESRLDVRLEVIHRQAEGNAIVEFASAVRSGLDFEEGEWGSVRIVGRRDFYGLMKWADQAICATNRTRHSANGRLRYDRGIGRQVLVEGERLICLQNNKDFGVFNGMGLAVDRVRSDDPVHLWCDLRTDDGEKMKGVPVRRDQLGRDRDRESRFHVDSVLCDYGYCVTAHKAQGSEWDKVLVLEEPCDAWDMRRWRYTAVTRAASELVYCRP